MFASHTPKTRRLNVMLSESLVACLSTTAQNKGMSVSAFVRRAVERECARTREEALEEAAAALASLYRSNKELTAFLALDGDDFA